MAGSITGLDWPAATGLIPAGADREAVVALLARWESGVIEGSSERGRGEKGK